MTWEPEVMAGHPELTTPDGVVITLCAGCQQMRTILWLSHDRWLCTNCRANGDTRPNLIPLGDRTEGE